MQRLLLCGTSTRAIAESAARAGFDVTAVDAFADLDQHPSVRALSIERDFPGVAVKGRSFATAMIRAAETLDADTAAYVAPFENHPAAVSRFAARRTLLGNPPETLRRVRDPFVLAATLRRHGFPIARVFNDPNVPNDPNEPGASWLLKPRRSGGGHGIRRWQGGTVPRTAYLQEWIDGTPGSLVFVAAGGVSIPLGFSRQLVGDAAFGTSGFRYCGNILSSFADGQFADGWALFETAARIAGVLVSEFGLVGINSVDFVVRDGVPFVAEVNPRWSSSVEIVERALRTNLFAIHAQACTAGAAPRILAASELQRTRAHGKAIVYAPCDGVVTDTSPWLSDAHIRDVPRSGTSVRAGQPVCSVLAAAPDSASCYRELTARAARVLATFQRSAVLAARG